MSRTFIAINDPVHNLVRGITRGTPLCPFRTPEGEPRVEHRFQPQELPDAYYTQAAFHALQGLPLAQARQTGCRLNAAAKAAVPELVGYFDVVRLDLRCCRDLRLKLRSEGAGLLAAELLTCGTGVLRARNDDPTERLYRHLWSQYGRIESRHERVYARIRALHQNSSPLPEVVGKEAFDSTNVIYGDVLGELEQLWERRADTAFLGQIVECLQTLRGTGTIGSFCHPPLAVDAVLKMHFRAQAIWKVPPKSARALLRRVEYILERTHVDSCPQTVYRWQEPQPQSQSATRGWQADSSGYDGWLGASSTN